MIRPAPFRSILVLLVLAACGGDAPADGAMDGTDPETAAEGSEAPRSGSAVEVPALGGGELMGLSRDAIRMTLPWTQGAITRDAVPDAPALTLAGAERLSGSNFDRLVFTFEGEGLFPGYRVESASASALEGCAEASLGEDEAGVRRIVFEPVAVGSGLASSLQAGSNGLQGVRRVCTEDDRVVWLTETSAPSEIRLIEATAPMRIIVDLRPTG